MSERSNRRTPFEMRLLQAADQLFNEFNDLPSMSVVHALEVAWANQQARLTNTLSADELVSGARDFLQRGSPDVAAVRAHDRVLTRQDQNLGVNIAAQVLSARGVIGP